MSQAQDCCRTGNRGGVNGAWTAPVRTKLNDRKMHLKCTVAITIMMRMMYNMMIYKTTKYCNIHKRDFAVILFLWRLWLKIPNPHTQLVDD